MRQMKQISGFGPIWGMSGVQGFFGGKGYRKEYKFHWLLGPLLNFNGMTFVAKTTTLDPCKGNMPLDKDGVCPAEWFPLCIYCDPKKEFAINAVGLSGPGAKHLFELGVWEKRRERFFLSFMSVAATPEERREEMKNFKELLMYKLATNCLQPQHYFQPQPGLQINVSCPNKNIEPAVIAGETIAYLDILRDLNIVLVPKFSVETPVAAVAEIAQHPACSGFCVSNTIPWDNLPGKIRRELTGDIVSPLIKRGMTKSGGVSGRFLLPRVIRWVQEARDAGITTHINAGGGIIYPQDVDLLYHAGADSVSIGTAVMVWARRLQPWMVQRIIKRAHKIFGGKDKYHA